MHRDDNHPLLGAHASQRSSGGKCITCVTILLIIATAAAGVFGIFWFTQYDPFAASGSGLGEGDTSIAMPDKTSLQAKYVSDFKAAMNASVDPCEDFYAYACGGWEAATPIPPSEGNVGRSFTVLGKQNAAIVQKLVENSQIPVVTDFYRACMRNNQNGAGTEFAAAVKSISQLKFDTPDDWAASLAVAYKLGVTPLMSISAGPGATTPELIIVSIDQNYGPFLKKDAYTATDEAGQQQLQVYNSTSRALLQAAGMNAADAAAMFEASFALDKKLAASAKSRNEIRAPNATVHPLGLSWLQQNAAFVNWTKLLSGLGVDTAPLMAPETAKTMLNVGVPEWVQGIQATVAAPPAQLAADPAGSYRAHILLRFLRAYASSGAAAYQQAILPWRLLQAGSSELPPRNEQCVGAIGSFAPLSAITGVYYAAKVFPESAKQKALAMVHAIEANFKKNLALVPWLDDAGRTSALAKLALITNRIGYPDKLNIDDLLRTPLQGLEWSDVVLALSQSETADAYSKVGGAPDKDLWGMPAYLVNAYYDPSTNNINFPAGIMSGYFFSEAYTSAQNFGSMGAVIGHELSHGFDDQGRDYDGHGALNMSQYDESVNKAFAKRATCVADFYSQLPLPKTTPPITGKMVDGRHTLGEDLADIAGLKNAYQAYVASGDYEKENAAVKAQFGMDAKQVFWTAYGQTWCSKFTRDALIARLKNEHSPGPDRVYGAVSLNADLFAKDFGCKKGKMIPDQKLLQQCQVW